jgi:hypothetical protein
LTKPENAATKEAESDASGGTTQGAGEAGETERLFPDTPLGLSSLNKADADVSLKVTELRYGGLALHDAVVGVNLESAACCNHPVAGRPCGRCGGR